MFLSMKSICDTKTFFDNLDKEVYLWYEDFLKDEDVLVNEVYLWYEDFLEDEDNLDNEVFCDTKASLKTKMF